MQRAIVYDADLHDKVNNAKLTTIICSGSEEKKREIFKRINTLGVPLSRYEVLNGLYHGEYLEGLEDYIRNDKNARHVLPTATIIFSLEKLLISIRQIYREPPNRIASFFLEKACLCTLFR